MNVYDSERMVTSLTPHGFTLTDEMDDADLVILNTCHIREKAAEKVYSDLGRIRKMKDKLREQQARDMVVAVAGCVAQAEGKEIMRRAPYVDIVVGTQAVKRLPEMVANAFELVESQKKSRIVELDFSTDEKFDMLAQEYDVQGVTAFVTIQEGCDKFCTYCVVPYTRGAEISRPVKQVVDEVTHLVASGVREVTLLGQNVNAYHGLGVDFKRWTMAELMKKLEKIPGLERLRYTTSHPADMQEDLLQAHRDNSKVMPYLHLPVQAGADRILKAMNRSHTKQDYIDVIERLRSYRPDLALSGDFIVGFPGETEEEFEDTMDLIRQVEYAQAYSFVYSPRPGTPAALLEDDVPLAVKKERLYQLQALLNEQQLRFNDSTVGKTLPVLFEKEGRNDRQYVGRTPYMQAITVESDRPLIGHMVDVRVTSTSPNALVGECVSFTEDVNISTMGRTAG